jgi:hypothetical protein
MMKIINGIVGINIRQSKSAYIITAILILAAIANEIVLSVVFGPHDTNMMALNNYLYILPLLIAIFVPARNFSKLINLGAKRMDFFKSSAFTYLYAAAAVTAASLALELIFGGMARTNADWLLSLFEVFGFMRNGPAAAYFQMAAFLLLFCCVLHTLTLVQGRWYGWALDAAIIAVISVFTPIAPLRTALGWFFTMIIFHDSALVQILSCLVLGAVVYAASLIPLTSKT